jgi:hypothetical protein
MSSECAETILSQLGGNRFIAMTGAKHLSSTPNSLNMALPQNPGRIQWVRIILDENDTYIVEFIRMVKRVPTTVTRVTDVYVDNLQEVFTRNTGFYTSL